MPIVLKSGRNVPGPKGRGVQLPSQQVAGFEFVHRCHFKESFLGEEEGVVDQLVRLLAGLETQTLNTLSVVEQTDVVVLQDLLSGTAST